jgi:tripartite-type tricarboxylate transporter receptor subunit TctC
MRLPRRQFLQLAAGSAALPAISRAGRAQTYPSRPVRIVVGFAPGGGVDIVARLIGGWLSQRLGQGFIIENKTGAASNIATEAVVKSQADGYTLLLVNAANAINASLYDNLNFSLIKDLAPVGGIIRVSLVMEVNPTFPAKTVPEFISYAKANPHKLSMASSGTGTTEHMAGELFKISTGISMAVVSYPGAGPALADLSAGRQVQVMFGSLPASIKYIKAGKLQPLAVTTAMKSEALPDVPTVGTFVSGYEASQWYGIAAPRNIPAEIVEKLNKEINAGLADPTFRARLTDLGGAALAGSPADFGKLIAYDTEKWSKVIRVANIKPG